MAKLAEVVVDVPLKDINKIFHYIVPNHLDSYIEVGSRVIVPFGNRTLQGYVVDLVDDSLHKGKYKLKEIETVFEYPPLLNENLIELAKWMSYSYCASLFPCIQSMLPRGVKLELTEMYSIRKETLDQDFNLFFNKPRSLGEIAQGLGLSKEVILSYIQKGYLEKDINVKTKIQEKIQQEISLDTDIEEISVPANALRQHELLELLENQQWLNLSELPTSLKSAAKSFMKKGYIKVRDKRIFREPDTLDMVEETPKTLTKEQSVALDALIESTDSPNEAYFLLKGITGSGKTEVYLRYANYCINKGLDVIILVPEIALTPMMVSRFKARFQDKVAVLHSGLTEAQKFDEWLKIKNSKVKIVVGARSAVFAPFKNLGLIIIDEEHESTYKQDVQPRYVTRHVAEYRIAQVKGTLVLGSATPRVESYYNGENGHYKLLELKNRANQKELPKISIVDMREELIQGNKSIFSRELYSSINETLNRKEQVVLFLNKRGFSSTTLCRGCGFTFKCPNCDVSLTSHHQGNFLICHYCNYSVNNPDQCPKCKGKHLKFNGLGTEKLKDEIVKHFPKAKVVRMDNDTMTTASSYNEVYQNFLDGKANVLIGTQMIAKGFDFPKVTLVGIILADLSLNFPDFRSGEKTFQLITQVAGRAGRADLSGKVILQTYTPEHYSIVHSSTYDYERFYTEELSLRRSLNYPPFTKMAKIEVMSKDESEAKTVISKISKELFERLTLEGGTQILGPVVPAIPKIRKMYRYILVIKYNEECGFLDVINNTNFNKYQNEKIASIKVDIDPGNLL